MQPKTRRLTLKRQAQADAKFDFDRDSRLASVLGCPSLPANEAINRNIRRHHGNDNTDNQLLYACIYDVTYRSLALRKHKSAKR